MAPRPTQVPYFRKLADYLRADLKSDDPTRQQGALERIRSALPATQPMSDEDVRSSFRHGDALDVIAVEQRAPDWRRFTAGEPGGAADDAAETVNEFLAWE